MKLNTYCVAHVVRERNYITGRINSIRKILDEHGIQAISHNLGYHVTFLAPFRTTEEAAKLLAWGLDLWDTVRVGENPTGERFGATGTGFDFFRSEKEDAFAISLLVDGYFMRAVERGRKRIPEIAEWVYPPTNYDFNPHITLCTGKGVANQIEPLVETGTISKRYATEAFHVDFEAPRVLRKTEGVTTRWEPVL